ncbi:SGNH/GDSL hydrolase family protein [Hymenobacter terrenus]|uniref:SGNH/GDSL hydrolase family protein n=1 Tax=Hymenobacter terrenus TaxID=1629124 RepID=UPI0009081EDD|nr:GDSL-type esterase/lipase family protein [Hymenobacter terrenus]
MRLLPLLISGLIFCCDGLFAPRPPKLLASAKPGVTFLSLGDSYTIGEGVGATARWPAQLAELARQEGLAIQSPDIIARTGWTTAELQTAIAATNNQKTYGLVSLLIGVNNQYRGETMASYRTEFRELLHKAGHFAGDEPRRVLVLSIPDWGRSPFAQREGRDPVRIAAEIDQFNAVAREECRRASVAYVDITPLTRAAASDPAQFTRDGLHYSGPQMHDWARLALPVVRQMLLSETSSRSQRAASQTSRPLLRLSQE